MNTYETNETIIGRTIYETTISVIERRKAFITKHQSYATKTLEAYEHVLEDLLGGGNFDGLFSEE